MKRLQVDISDAARALLEERVKAQGITMSAYLDRLILSPGPQAASVSDDTMFRVLMTRLEQIEEALGAGRAQRDALDNRLGAVTQATAQVQQEIGALREHHQYAVKLLEPLAGVALRPGVLYNPPRKKRWWQRKG